MFVYTRVHVCTCVYVRVSACAYACVCICVYARIHKYVRVCMCKRAHTRQACNKNTGLARSIHIIYIYIYIYGAYTVFWQGNHQIQGQVQCMCMVLANPELKTASVVSQVGW